MEWFVYKENPNARTVEKWYGIEVKTKEAGFMYFAEGMQMLIEDECPFCASEEEAK